MQISQTTRVHSPRTFNCQVPLTEYSNCLSSWIQNALYSIKSPVTGHEIPPISTLKKLKCEKCHTLPKKLYKLCILLTSLLFLAWEEAATLPVFFSLSINLLYEVCHTVWLCGISWLPVARIPFRLSCNANNYESSLVFLSTYRPAKIVKQCHPHTNTKMYYSHL